MPGRVAEGEVAPARIEDDQADRQARKHLNEAVHAGLHSHDLVACVFDRPDTLLHFLALLPLQLKCLDDANPLRRLPHGPDNSGEGEILALRHVAYALGKLADGNGDEGSADKADGGHDRVLRHHDDNEPDQGKRITAEAHHYDVEHVARCAGVVGDPCDEVVRWVALEEGHVHLQNMVEHAPLHLGHEAVADASEQDLLGIGGDAP